MQDLAARNAKLFPDKTCLVSEGRRYTFREAEGRIGRLSGALSSLGVRYGDRVALLLENCSEYVEIYFALASLGAIAVPLNYRLSTGELAFVLRDSQPCGLVFGADFSRAADAISGDLGDPGFRICTGGAASFLAYEELVGAGKPRPPDPSVSENDVAILLYTGGTTGRPKGVMCTHRNLIANAARLVIETRVVHDDILLVVTPLFHSGSVWPMVLAASLGSTLVVMRKYESPESVLDTVAKERVSAPWLLSAVLGHIAEAPDLDRFDLSCVRVIATGGSHISADRIRRVIDRMRCSLWIGGGQTEAGIISSIRFEENLDSPADVLSRRLASVGRAAYDVNVKVVDDEGRDVQWPGVGELVAQSNTVMQGYWRQPEETARALRHGWIHTGDLVKVDEDGYITYVDRKKDMIKSGGENIYSLEVEEAIGSHPQVREVAVIGVPDERWGEAVKALVVLDPGATATEEAIISHCAARLASFKKPKTVEFVESLPKSSVGKVLKHQLRDKYWAGFERRVN